MDGGRVRATLRPNRVLAPCLLVISRAILALRSIRARQLPPYHIPLPGPDDQRIRVAEFSSAVRSRQ
jgi:hypothetical protein